MIELHRRFTAELYTRVAEYKKVLAQLCETPGMQCEQYKAISDILELFKNIQKRADAICKATVLYETPQLYTEWHWFDKEIKRITEKIEDRFGNSANMMPFVSGLIAIAHFVEDCAYEFEQLYLPILKLEVQAKLKS